LGYCVQRISLRDVPREIADRQTSAPTSGRFHGARRKPRISYFLWMGSEQQHDAPYSPRLSRATAESFADGFAPGESGRCLPRRGPERSPPQMGGEAVSGQPRDQLENSATRGEQSILG